MPFLDPRYVSSGFTSGRGPFCQTGQPPLGAPSNELRPKKQSYGDDGAGRDHPDSDHCRDSRNILLLLQVIVLVGALRAALADAMIPRAGYGGLHRCASYCFAFTRPWRRCSSSAASRLPSNSWSGGWGLGGYPCFDDGQWGRFRYLGDAVRCDGNTFAAVGPHVSRA